MPSYAGPAPARPADIAGTLRLLGYLALGVALIVLDHRGGWLKQIRGQAELITQPLWWIAGLPGRIGNSVHDDAATRTRLSEDNRLLRNALLISGARLANTGFLFCGLGALANVLYNLFVPTPSVPWAVLPMAIGSFGIALVFPILTLAVLDMYPRQRGSASSLQAFTSLVMNAIVAGVLSPLLSHRGIHLAVGAAAFSLIAWLFWRWENRPGRPLPAAQPEAAALEPTQL